MEIPSIALHDPAGLAPRNRWALAILLAAVALCLLPFLDKPVNLDDPVYIWVGKQITSKWWDFYAGWINWYGTPMRTSEFMMNPPLTSYYLAAVGQIFGWSERSLHGGMLLPALGATWGTYGLARRFCAHPGLASGAAVLSPVFVVSSTTIMSDVLMVCLWIWATLAWMEGVRRKNHRMLAAGAILILISALAKYFAMCLVPLLAVYAIISWRGTRWGLLWLLIPLVGLLGYQFYTNHLYSTGSLGRAMQYATVHRAGDPGSGRPRVLTALSFLGGCLATAVPGACVVFAGIIGRHRRRAWLYLVLVFCILTGLLWLELPTIEQFASGTQIARSVIIQLLLFAAGGTVIMGVAIDELRRWRDGDSFLLGMTVVGTFVFVAAFNWTVSARTILPMAPAIGILVVRGLERRNLLRASHERLIWMGTLVLLVPLSIGVARADEKFAMCEREASDYIKSRVGLSNTRVWFQGHWGFQYYMQQWGAQPLDAASTLCLPGDLLVVPTENSNLFATPAGAVQLIDRIEPWQPSWVATLDVKTRAGFYSDSSGPLPFAFGSGTPVRYDVYRVEHSIQYKPLQRSYPAMNRPVASAQFKFASN